MLDIIKYYVIGRHGIALIMAALVFLLLKLWMFEDSFMDSFILFGIMIPYIDMFTFHKEQKGIKTIDISLPLSFNKVWLAKTICLGLYLIFLVGIYLVTLFNSKDGHVSDIMEFTYLSLLIFMMLFVIGKVKLYKKGNVRLIGFTILSIGFFFWIIVGVLFLPFALSPMENMLWYHLISYVLPLAIVHAVDYKIAKSNWKYSLRNV